MNHNYNLCNTDTDSISFSKPDGAEFTPEEQQTLINEINSLMPDMIEYEHDGYFEKILVIKAKNYILQEKGSDTKTYKGSSIRDNKKEPALRQMLNELITDIMDNESKNLKQIYHKFVYEANNINDIQEWAKKYSVSKAVLNPPRTNELKILNAIKHLNPREGDKFWLYPTIDGEKQKMVKGELVFLKSGEPSMVPNKILKCVDEWEKDEDTEHYSKRVYKTMKIMEKVLDMSEYLNYSLKGNQKLINDITKDGDILDDEKG